MSAEGHALGLRHGRRGWSVRLLIPLMLVGACGDSPQSAPAMSETLDSAGVTIIRHVDRTIDTLGVQLVETLRLGTVDGAEESQFYRINGVAVDALGRFFVIDQSTQSVRVFTADGHFVRRFGGTGHGPGQFTFIGQLFIWRDTIHVADLRDFRTTLFDTAGVHLASWTSLLPNGSRLRLLSGGSTGWFVADDSLMSGRGREQIGVARRTLTEIKHVDPQMLARAIASRETADSLLVPVTAWHGMRSFGMLGSEGGNEQFVLGNPPFFEPQADHAFDGQGRVHIAHGWPYLIDTYDANGMLTRRLTRAHDSIPVTDALVAEVLRRAQQYYDTTSQRRGASYHTYSERAKMPRIGFLPVTRNLRASTDGWLWVRRVDLEPDPAALEWDMRAPARPSYWDVFDPDGAFRMTVPLPPRFTLLHVQANAGIGVQRDELDVEYVVRYEIRRDAREPGQ